ncbi:hypothetical protein Droror1_Dr00025970 [Drosera rotundifolia]
MDFSSSPSSSSHSQYKELARAATEGGIRPWLTVASPDMSTVDATTHTATTTTTTTTSNNNNNNKLEDEDEAVTTTTTKDNNTETTQAAATIYIEREHMFDKVVTPSDVGKLNRLVIPKQHAEKYFPLDSAANEKGLLLNFEDRSGKAWRFRYSYWNSSQSYVMTKGWSRFVKEKKLDAGDIISFQRGIGEVGKDRFFIDWRRRQPEMMPPLLPPRLLHFGNDHPGAAILFPAGGYHGISFNPSQYHHQGQYRYHQNHHHQYLSSAAPNWSSNIGQPLIVRPPPPLPPPPPPLVQQQQLPVLVRDHYNPHYHGQMKQVNMINMVCQQQHHPGNQYQHDRNVNVVGRSSSGVGVHHDYYHQQQYHNGNHHDQNNYHEYDLHGREAGLSPPRGASCSSIVYMNGSVTDPGRGGCRGGGRSNSTAYDMVPVNVQPREAAVAAPKQLRLFGVNMDCSISQSDHDGNVVFGVDVVATSQHHDIHNHHNRDDHDHQLSNSQNAAVSAPFQLRLFGDNPTNSTSLRTSSQSHLQEKGKSSLSLDLGI